MVAVSLHELLQLKSRPVLGRDQIADVGAVKSADEDLRAAETKALQYLAPGGSVSGRGQRYPGNIREAVEHPRQLQVVGSEVVPPLRDTVRLVDGEEGQPAALKESQRAASQQAFRCHVQQVNKSVPHRRFDIQDFRVGKGRIQVRRPHSGLAQARHLIAHERDQRRNDYPDAVAHQSRNLVAERLAATSRHKDQAVATANGAIDHCLLLTHEVAEAEHPVQDVANVAAHGHDAGGC